MRVFIASIVTGVFTLFAMVLLSVGSIIATGGTLLARFGIKSAIRIIGKSNSKAAIGMNEILFGALKEIK